MKKTIKYKNNIIGRSFEDILKTKKLIITIITIILAIILLIGAGYLISL